MLSVCSEDCCVGVVLLLLLRNSLSRDWKPGSSVLESLGLLRKKSALGVGCCPLVVRLG